MPEEYSEDSYIINDIIPALAHYGYPPAGDHQNLKIKNDVSIRIGSGRLLAPDVVYFANNQPLLVVEAKTPYRSVQSALEEVKSYIRNLQFNPSPPKFFAITLGRTIKMYKYYIDLQNGQLIDGHKELTSILNYEELQFEYGIRAQKPLLTSDLFKDLFYELARIYITVANTELTPNIIKKVTLQLYEFLKDKQNYVSKQPYISLDGIHERQLAIRNILTQYDWTNSFGEDLAFEFREQILRSFQGINLNQYLTPIEVVSFMVNLVDIKKDDTVLDFECGSGSFIAAAIRKGVPIVNVLGIEIADLPYYVSKTYLALYYAITGDAIESIPILFANGLLHQENNYSIVIGNPAGSSEYVLDDTLSVIQNLENDIDQNGRPDPISEYYFSIQQAVNRARVGGKICLILPDSGIFSNSSSDNLRKYISKYCEIKSIISLPRGIFYKGTTTRTVTSGAQQSNQKMSILYCIKKSEVQKGSGVIINIEDLKYPVFLASIEKNENLENDLSFILNQYKFWEHNKSLNISETEPAKKVKVNIQLEKPTQQHLLPPDAPLLETIEKAEQEKPKTESVSTIDSPLEELFEDTKK